MVINLTRCYIFIIIMTCMPFYNILVSIRVCNLVYLIFYRYVNTLRVMISITHILDKDAFFDHENYNFTHQVYFIRRIYGERFRLFPYIYNRYVFLSPFSLYFYSCYLFLTPSHLHN